MKYAILYLDAQQPATMGLLGHVFDKMTAEGLLERVFYDGTIRTAEEFLADVLRPGSLPFVIMAGEEIAAFAWLNALQGKSARSHFVIFRKFWGRKIRGEMGRRFFRYVLWLRDEDGFLFDCLYGVTPENNPLAWKAALQSGWRLIGTIPQRVFLAGTGKSVGGVITVATREILGVAEEKITEATWGA